MALLSRDQAWKRIAKRARPLEAVELPLAEAVDRYLARDVVSPIDVPGFDRSAMDGWALRSEDAPGRLWIAGEVAAGSVADFDLQPRTAIRIFTGGAIPPGADSVEKQEVVKTDDGHVVIDHEVPKGQHIRYRGEDVAAGTTVATTGDRVTVQGLTALAACGLASVPVHRPPKVAILRTGDELVPPGKSLGPGQIHETSGVALAALIERAGAQPLDLGTAPDDPGAIANRVQLGLHRADVLLVAGGVSVGEHDHVKGAFESAGVEELFWGVRIKPGKPLFCGLRDQKWAFGLPGNPLSGIVSFLVFVEPLLKRMQGDHDATERRVRTTTTVPISAMDGRTTYLTATFGPDGATPTEQQGSAMTLALARADGFVIADGDIEAGSEVDALPL